MSLIGEALKRARLEAARREGEERGTAHSSMPAYLPARRRSRAGAVAATALAALVGAGAVYFLLRQPPATSSAPATLPHPPLLGKEGPTAADTRTDPAAPVPSASTAAATAANSAEPPRPSPIPSAPRSQPPPAAAPTAPASRPAPGADPVPPGARVYVRLAKLGATQLELDGIVASPTDPVAMIKRKLMGIGEGVEGWVVEKIEAKQVTLRGGRDTIVLRLR